MENKLWELLLQSGISDEQIGSCQYILKKSGSPYYETDKKNAEPGQTIEVNPYPRMYNVLAPVLEEKWRDSVQGQVLFQLFTELMLKTDCYQGYDRDSFLKEKMQNEIEAGCFGTGTAAFYKELVTYQKNATLEYLLMLYRNNEQIYSFVYEMQMLFLDCLLFRERQWNEKEHKTIYICMGTCKTKKMEWQFECVKKLFLPSDVNICITWDNPFLLTDINDMEPLGNVIT